MMFQFTLPEKQAIRWLLLRYRDADTDLRRFNEPTFSMENEQLSKDELAWLMERLEYLKYIQPSGFSYQWDICPKVIELAEEIRQQERVEEEARQREKESERNVLNKIVKKAEAHPIPAWIIVITIILNSLFGLLNGAWEFFERSSLVNTHQSSRSANP